MELPRPHLPELTEQDTAEVAHLLLRFLIL